MFNDSLFSEIESEVKNVEVVEGELPEHIVELPVSHQVVCKNAKGEIEPINTYLFKDNNKSASTAMAKAKTLQIIAKNSQSASLKNNVYYVVAKIKHVDTNLNKVVNNVVETYYPKF